MKVEGRAPWPVDKIYKNQAAARPNKGEKESAMEKADSLEISSHALVIQKLIEEANKLPEEREGLVEAIKAKITAGTYQVPPERVAESMLKGRIGK